MARQRREVVVAFVGKDELTSEIQRLKNELGQVKTAGGGAAEGLERINRTSAAAGTNLRAFATTTRFAATQVLSELNPALGSSVAQMTSMASVARATGGTLLTVFGVAGFAAVVAGLGLYLRSLKEANAEKMETQRILREFDTSAATGQLKKVTQELERVRDAWKGLTVVVGATEGFEGVEVPADQAGGFMGAILRRLIGDPKQAEQDVADAKSLFDETRGISRDVERLQAELSTLAAKEKLFVTGMAGQPLSGAMIRLQEQSALQAIERRQALEIQLEMRHREQQLAQTGLTEQERQHIIATSLLKIAEIEATGAQAKLVAKNQSKDAYLTIVHEEAAKAQQITRAFVDEEIAEFRRLDQERAGSARALLAIRDEFGEAGLLGAIQAIGPAFDANLIDKINELEDPTMRMLRNYQQSLREMQRAAEEFARSTASFISSTLFDFLEGRVKSFDEFFRRTFINLARVQVERLIFQGLAPRSGGAGGFFSVAAPASLALAGGPGGGAGPFAAAQGFTQQQALAELAGFGGGGSGAGPGGTIGNIGTGLGAIGQFLHAPLLTFGTDIGAAALGGAEAAFGGVGAGIGVSALGILAAGLGGVGLGATLFPQGGIGPMIGGGIGGIGGFIGGAALGGALGIASTAALAVILPGVGAILGAVAGSFLGSLFGGSDRAKNVARSRRANQIAQGVSGQIAAWARDHPVLGPPLLALAQFAMGVQTTGRRSSRNQLNVAAGLRSLFSGRVPSDAEVLGFLRSFGPATILTRGLGLSPPSGSLDEIQRLERIALSATDFLDIGGALFVEEGARLGILGVEQLITAGLLPQSIESAEVVRTGGIQRLRIKQRQVEAVEQMAPEVAEALLRKLIKELERLGIPHGNLVEAFQ